MPALSADDRDNLIRTVIGEVDPKDPDAGRAAVAHVVLNRLSTGRYGKTATDVVHQRGQFEPWARRARELLAIDPQSKAYQRTADIVDAVVAGDTPDPTAGATHFYSPRDQAALGRRAPSWAQGDGTAIGGHTFFAPNGPVPPRTAQAAISQALGDQPGLTSALPFDRTAQPGAPASADDVLAAWAGGDGSAIPVKTVKTVPVAPAPGTDEELFNDWTRSGPIIVPQAAADQRSAEFGHAPKGRGERLPPVVDMPIRGTPEVEALAKSRGYPAQVLQGAPIVAPLVDAATAAGAALLPGTTVAPLKGSDAAAPFSDRFFSNVEDIKRADQYFQQVHPVGSRLAQATGTVASMVPFGMTSIGSRALGMTGTSLGSRIYQGAGGGGVIAGLDAALRGEDPENIGKQTLFGIAGGAAGPIAGDAVARATSGLLNNAYPRPGPLGDVNRVAREMLSGALEGETPASLQAARERMGQRGYLADVNPAMTDLAGGIADTPGPGKQVIREAYRQRAAGQFDAIEGHLSRAMGPPTNIVDHTRFLTEARKAAADPLYQQFRSSQIKPTPEIDALIPRLEAAGAFDQAEKLAGITGDNVNRTIFKSGVTQLNTGTATQFPTAQSWDYVKRGLDAQIDKAYSAGDKTTARALVGLKHEMIGEIEKTPGGQVWRQARSEFADRSALIDQISAGRDTFLGSRSGLTVDELRDELRGLSGPELAARIQGMRSAASDAMGDSLRGDTTMRNKLLARNNQSKIRLMIGDDRGNELIRSLEQERHLSAQDQNVRGGSQTTPKKERVDALAPQPTAAWNPNITSPLSLIPPSWIDAIRPSTILEGSRADRHANALRQMAPILTTERGPGFDALISDLMREQAIAQRSAMVGGRLGRGTTGAVTGVASPEERSRLYGGGNAGPALVSPAR